MNESTDRKLPVEQISTVAVSKPGSISVVFVSDWRQKIFAVEGVYATNISGIECVRNSEFSHDSLLYANKSVIHFVIDPDFAFFGFLREVTAYAVFGDTVIADSAQCHLEEAIRRGRETNTVLVAKPIVKSVSAG